MIYLASPLSHPDPRVRDARFWAAASAAARLLREGELVFCPITMTVPIQQAGGLPDGWTFWRDLDIWYLERADELVVLTLPGWAESEGVSAEIEFAARRGLPIRRLEPSAEELAILERRKRRGTRKGK